MSGMKKHVGKLRNTDQRCVVVFMQIPDRPDYALVVATDSLPPRIEAPLMSILESPEAQSTPVLAHVLGRRMVPETGSHFLQVLHEAGLLHATPVDNVIMMPMPNMPFPLRKVLEQMTENGDALPLSAEPAPEVPAEPKYNPYGQTAENDTSDASKLIAANLLAEAIDLETIAAAKRAAAYNHDASLRPAPAPVVEAVKDAPAKKTTAKKTGSARVTG